MFDEIKLPYGDMTYIRIRNSAHQSIYVATMLMEHSIDEKIVCSVN